MDKDTLLAIKNEYRDMINMLGHRVKVERLPVAHGEGLLCKWKFNVNAPSYYISSKDDVDPKRTNNMVFIWSYQMVSLKQPRRYIIRLIKCLPASMCIGREPSV